MLPPKFQRRLPLQSRVEVRIDSLSNGGDGVARIEGCVVFVPGAVPGDTLLVEITAVQRNHTRASLLEIRDPSPDRREPRCAHFGACGGCSWQHVSAAVQRQTKSRLVRDALERVGGIAWPGAIEILWGDEYGYRSRASLSLAGKGVARRLGYRRARSHDVEAIAECPVLAEPLRAEVTRLAGDLSSVPRSAREVHLAAGDGGAHAIAIDESGRACIRSEEGSTITASVLGHSYEFDALGFFQANSLLIAPLVQAATTGARGRRALDLYSGAGLFTLALAGSFTEVLGVEGDARAVELARRNAVLNQVTNARFEAADVLSFLERTELAPGIDCVLLDPPRTGAGLGVVRGILALAPREVRYVSCDPATFARDAALFVAAGYTLESVVALDLFPQTPHVEVVACLRRST